MAESTLHTILLIDCGSVTTTVALIEPVNGHYRLTATSQAPSTYPPPWQDITIGMLEAGRNIEKAVNRTLFTPGGWPITPQNSNHQGVDGVIIVSSAGPPLPVMLVGLMKNISLSSAQRAAATTYTCLTGELALDLGRDSGPSRFSAETQLQAIQEGQPEVIILVGGTDDSAPNMVVELARLIAMSMRIITNIDKPTILYAGNRAARSQVAEILGPMASLRAVDNIRPTLLVENLAPLQLELENLYIQRKMLLLPGFQKLANWSPYPVIPAYQSFEKVMAYISQHNKLDVIGANVGSGATVISVQTRSYRSSVIRSDAGVGHGLAGLLKNTPLEKFQRWLPFELTLAELHNRLLNKCLYPTSLPETEEDLLIEHAIAREALRLVVEQTLAGQPVAETKQRRWNLIIGAGRALTRTPRPGYAALILLDALEPWGVTGLALDAAGVVNMLGAMAAIQPLAAVELGIQDTFLNLGTVIAPTGHGQPGKPALKLKVKYAHGRSEEVEVAYGTIRVIPLPPGEKAALEIRPARHFDIGLGQPGRGALTEVEGGILGIVIDARGRPLRLSKDEVQRQAQIRQWLGELGGYATTGEKN